MKENTERHGEFGWRYFHFVDPSGYRINVVEHQTDIFGLENTPYMTMITKEPDKSAIRFKGESNVLWEQNTGNKTGKFDFIFDNSRFSGNITETIQNRKLTDVVLYEDRTGRKSHWAVDLPYGKVTGELEISQVKKQITGYVYQDRQWGNILIQEWVKNWTWTYLANQDLFVVIFCINGVDNQKSWHSIHGQGQKVSIGHILEISHIIKLEESKNPHESTFQAKVKIPGKLSGAFSLKPNNVMRARMNENHPGFSASYIRWSVDGTISLSTKPVYGVAEYMSIQKK